MIDKQLYSSRSMFEMSPVVLKKVFIQDEICVAVARFAEVRRAYFDIYVPEGRKRGMTLEGAWRSPPIDVAGRESTLHILWSLPDPGAWWAMRLADVEAKSLWWGFVDSIAASRKRTIMTDAFEAGDDV